MARRAYPKEAFSVGAPPPSNPAPNPFAPNTGYGYQQNPTGQPNQGFGEQVPASPLFTPQPQVNPPNNAISSPFGSGGGTGLAPAPVPMGYSTTSTVPVPALEPLPVSLEPPPRFTAPTTFQPPPLNQPPQGPRHAPPPAIGEQPPPPSAVGAPVDGQPSLAQQSHLIGKRPVAYPEPPRSQFAPSPAYGSDTFGTAASQATGPAQRPTTTASSPPEPRPEWAPDRTFVRCTLETWPASNEILDKTGLPFGISFHPLAGSEKPVPVVNFGECNIIRCKTCRAYVNPYVTFVEGGKRWKCNLCYYLNDVPREYFSIVGNNGLRYDHADRPELNHSVVEFVASSEFMNRPPQPPVYFFVIDVSYTAVVSGMVRATCNSIYQAIDKHLSNNKRTKVGFLTYDSSIHFYNLRSSLSSPQMLVIPEIDNPFSPHPDDLLVNLAESRHLVDKLLTELLPNLFQQGQENASALGPALRGAYSVLNAQGGKLLLFQSILPSLGVGKLPVRETTASDPTGRQLMQPGEQFYKNLALEFAKVQIGCDLFFFTPKYIDVATIGCLAKFTGGEINYYQLNQFSTNEASRLQNDVYRTLTRVNGFEALMRVRCTVGLTLDSHHGSYFLRAQDLFNLPNTDSDKAFSMKVKISDAKAFLSDRNLARDGRHYATIQAGLLYTTTQGERRIRIVTKCCPISHQVSDLYRDVDQQAVANLVGNLAITKAFDEGIPKAIIAIKNACAHVLTQYANTSGPSQAAGSVSLPHTLANFPIYTLALIKNIMFRSDALIDERLAAIRRYETLPVEYAMLSIYPNLYNISNLAPEAGQAVDPFVMPPTLELSIEKLDQRSVFLLDNGQSFYLWVGSLTDPSILNALFNINSLAEVDQSNSQLQLIRLENDLSQRVNNIVDRLRRGRSGYTWLYALKEKDPNERKFFSQLVHDRFPDSNSFREFVGELKNIVTQRRGK